MQEAMKDDILSSRKQQAILLLLEGKSMVQVAKELDVDRNTIARWRKEPLFLEELCRQQKEQAQLITLRLEALTTKAVDVCCQALEEGNVKVALTLLERFDRIQERATNDERNLPRINVQIIEPMHNYTVNAEDLIEANRKLLQSEQ